LLFWNKKGTILQVNFEKDLIEVLRIFNKNKPS